MDLEDIPSFKDDKLKIDVRSQGSEAALVAFAGTLTMRDPGPALQPLFERLHRWLVSRARRTVRVNLRELRFMNSSSFKHFMSWVQANNDLPDGQRYHIHFMLNPNHSWQTVSMHALRCFSHDEITTEPAMGG